LHAHTALSSLSIALLPLLIRADPETRRLLFTTFGGFDEEFPLRTELESFGGGALAWQKSTKIPSKIKF